MSKIYQVFMKEDVKDLDFIVGQFNGHINDIGNITIERNGAFIWIHYNGSNIDSKYYEDEIREIMGLYNFEAHYCIDIELDSSGESEEIVLDFYKCLKNKYKEIILMDQNGNCK